MDIHQLSEQLATAGVKHVKVLAKAGGSIKDIKGLVSSIKSKEGKAFAQEYFDWVEGGRKGAPPKGDCDFKTIKYVRAVVSTIAG